MSNYVTIFEDVLYVLRQFIESKEALSNKEIGYRLGVGGRTAQRMTKSLQEGGWLDFKKDGNHKIYFATDKAKQLLGVNA